MDLLMLKSFFFWSSIINIGLLLLSALIIKIANEYICHKHALWYRLPHETIRSNLYLMLGCYKLGIFLFSLVPWIVLCIITK